MSRSVCIDFENDTLEFKGYFEHKGCPFDPEISKPSNISTLEIIADGEDVRALVTFKGDQE